jgi:hypothetical protein
MIPAKSVYVSNADSMDAPMSVIGNGALDRRSGATVGRMKPIRSRSRPNAQVISKGDLHRLLGAAAGH